MRPCSRWTITRQAATVTAMTVEGMQSETEAELTVVGGGLVGLTLAIACAEGGIRTIVIEAGDGEPALREAAAEIAGAGRKVERAHTWPHQAAPHQPLEQPVGIGGAVARIILRGLAEIGGEFRAPVHASL